MSVLRTKNDPTYIPSEKVNNEELWKVNVLSRVYIELNNSSTKPMEWVFIDCQKDEEHISKWVELASLQQYSSCMILYTVLLLDVELPEELSTQVKRLSASLSSLQEQSSSQLKLLSQEYETYKKRSKAATALLQEKTGSVNNQIDALQKEVEN